VAYAAFPVLAVSGAGFRRVCGAGLGARIPASCFREAGGLSVAVALGLDVRPGLAFAVAFGVVFRNLVAGCRRRSEGVPVPRALCGGAGCLLRVVAGLGAQLKVFALRHAGCFSIAEAFAVVQYVSAVVLAGLASV